MKSREFCKTKCKRFCENCLRANKCCYDCKNKCSHKKQLERY